MSPAVVSRATLVLGLLALPAAVAVASGRPEAILLWALLAPSAVTLWRLAARRARPAARVSLAGAEAPPRVSGAARAGGCLGCLSLVWGGIALITLPALLAARASSNMNVAKRDVRAVVTAEWERATKNGGLFLPIQELGLTEAALPERAGYRRSFHPVPASAEEVSRAGAAPGSLRAFAYSAAPVRPPGDWGPTGLYAFCADSEERFCHTLSGRPPTVSEGRCPPPKAGSALDDYECGSGEPY